MYVFKPFQNSDIITSPKEVNKSFSVVSSAYETNGIKSTLVTEAQKNIHNSIEHLYYSNYKFSKGGQVESKFLSEDNGFGEQIDEDNVFLYENYLNTTLNPYRLPPPRIGDDPINIGVISIPKNLYGDHIKPNSFKITGPLIDVEDNGDGILVYRSGSWDYPVGNIIYEHGIAILSPRSILPVGYVPSSSSEGGTVYGEAIYGDAVYGGNVVLFAGEGDPPPPTVYNFEEPIMASLITGATTIEFKSSYTLYENQYKCSINNNEFNASHNSTLKEDKDGNLLFFAKEQYFTPYVTSVGLYNENHELLAVAKLSKPLPTSKDNDMNIVIKMDKL